MKFNVFVFALFLSAGALAQDIYLDDYNYTVTDVASRGLTKEDIFKGMDRKFIKLSSSICSNRAQVWTHNMKADLRIDAAKVFVFYTDLKAEASDTRWWYHVTPVVNENGKLWTVDAGFPGWVKSPLSIPDWLKKFTTSTNCKEIKKGDEDLIEHIFKQAQFPRSTRHGNYDCYYRITSAPYWTPGAVAKHLLGRDEYGNPTNYVRETINTGELLQACEEASTTSIGGFFTNKRKKCLKYFGWRD